MPKGKERRHRLTTLARRMEERGETPDTLSARTSTISPGRIRDLMLSEYHSALDHETLELANALACFPENLTGAKPKDPVRMHAHGGTSVPKGMSIREDNWSKF